MAKYSPRPPYEINCARSCCASITEKSEKSALRCSQSLKGLMEICSHLMSKFNCTHTHQPYNVCIATEEKRNSHKLHLCLPGRVYCTFKSVPSKPQYIDKAKLQTVFHIVILFTPHVYTVYTLHIIFIHTDCKIHSHNPQTQLKLHTVTGI